MNNDKKHLLISAVTHFAISSAFLTLKDKIDVVVVEDVPKELKATEIPLIPLERSPKAKLIEDRGVIPPKYKKKHHRK